MEREEAIEAIKAKMDYYESDKRLRAALETLVPELRESKGERMRKELIEFIEWSVDRHFMREDFHQAKRPSEWIAYLEKQKYDRMQPIYDSIDSFESALDKAWKAYNDSGARTVDGCEDDYVECAHAKGFREGYLFGLEKQKENPKSADSIPSDCVSDAKCEDRSPKHSDSDGTDIRDTPAYWKGWDDAMKQKEQNHPNGCFTCDEYKKGYEAGRLNGFTAGYNKAMKEVDQKEQKPLSTEETELNSIAFLEQMGYTCVPPKKEHQNDSDAPKNALGGALNSPLDKDKNLDDIAQEYVDNVKKYNPEFTWNLMQTAVCYGYHYREQEEHSMSAEEEWSEEDEEAIKDAIKLLEAYYTDAIEDYCPHNAETLKKLINVLKSLRPQPKQEWSGEDKNTINLMIAILRENHPNGLFKTNPVNTTCMSAISTDMLIKRIESLRPSWRPSEEQMDSLRDTIVQTKGYSYSMYLPELYEQLKKLM